MPLVTPAILASSMQDFEEKLARFTLVPAVRRIQIDVVDGRFARPACWPYARPGQFRELIGREALPHIGRFEYEIDLMVLEPEAAALAFIELGASRLVFHAESTTSLGRLLALMRRLGGHEKGFTGMLSVGLALGNASELSLIEPYLGQIDFVQFMGIARIGAQGQPFDPRVLERIRAFRRRHPEMPVQVDGGVTLETGKRLLAEGAETFVVGHDLLEADDSAAELRRFDELLPQYGV